MSELRGNVTGAEVMGWLCLDSAWNGVCKGTGEREWQRRRKTRGLSKVDSDHVALRPRLFPFEVPSVGFSEVGIQKSETQEEENGGAERKQAHQLYGQESPDLEAN